MTLPRATAADADEAMRRAGKYGIDPHKFATTDIVSAILVFGGILLAMLI